MAGGASPRVVITGVAGYIGSHAALACLDAGWSVVGVDDLSVGREGSVPPGVAFHRMDCTDPGIAGLLAEADAAIHFAGRISVEESVRDPALYYENNTATAVRFFAHAAAAGLGALVFSSTAAVYGDQPGGAVTEASPTVPGSPYGRSKLAAEWALRDIAAVRPLPHMILRYFNVAGADPALRAGPSPRATHLVKRIAEAATGQIGGVTVNGRDYGTPDGTCQRDYIHVSDLAQIHLAAVRHLLAGGESAVLNCGYGRGYSVQEVIERAEAIAPMPFEVGDGPRRAGDVERVVADNRKLLSTLDWTPEHDDLDTILRSAIDWELKTLAAVPPVRRTGT